MRKVGRHAGRAAVAALLAAISATTLAVATGPASGAPAAGGVGGTSARGVASAPAAARAAAARSCGGGAATASRPGWVTTRLAWRAQPIVVVRPLPHVPRRAAGRARRPARRAFAAARARRPARRALAPDVGRWLLVLATARGSDGRCWAKLRLPWRPNDASGWAPAERLLMRPTPWRIEVSRAARTLTLLRNGRPVRTTRVVIGARGTPTPGGLFATVGAWSNSPRDFSGAWILGLTAHSRALRHFDGGDGQVAIHGRGGSSLIDPLGSARSHGCMRVSNRPLDAIVQRIGRAEIAGVPVRVR